MTGSPTTTAATTAAVRLKLRPPRAECCEVARSGYTGCTSCASPYICQVSNVWYSHGLQGTNAKAAITFNETEPIGRRDARLETEEVHIAVL